MPTWLASLLAALIGAGAGSIGAVLTSDWRKRKAETSERREAFVQRYLFQLQDACETLWYRLDNVSRKGGRLVMDDAYFETTSLYALGRLLAMEHRIDYELGGGFYQYDRIAPAEAVVERETDRFRASTYLELRRRYEDSLLREKEWLKPARDAVQLLTDERIEKLKKRLHAVALRISQETGTPSGFGFGPALPPGGSWSATR
jgi:hypothetical protein